MMPLQAFLSAGIVAGALLIPAPQFGLVKPDLQVRRKEAPAPATYPATVAFEMLKWQGRHMRF